MPPTPPGQHVRRGPSRRLLPAAWIEGVVAIARVGLTSQLPGEMCQRDLDRHLCRPRLHACTKGFARTSCQTPASCGGGPSPARDAAADLPL